MRTVGKCQMCDCRDVEVQEDLAVEIDGQSLKINVDDDFGVRSYYFTIEYCPWCGREL